MNKYHIKIDGMYFVDISDETIGKAPTGGWYDEGAGVSRLVLSAEQDKARLIEGNINREPPTTYASLRGGASSDLCVLAER